MDADSSLQPSLDTLITAAPEILGGRRVFRGTRIPIEILFENLADGMTLDEILQESPTLDRNDAVRLLELTAANPATPYSSPTTRTWVSSKISQAGPSRSLPCH